MQELQQRSLSLGASIRPRIQRCPCRGVLRASTRTDRLQTRELRLVLAREPSHGAKPGSWMPISNPGLAWPGLPSLAQPGSPASRPGVSARAT